MENKYHIQALTDGSRSGVPSRVLASTSGNIQAIPSACKTEDFKEEQISFSQCDVQNDIPYHHQYPRPKTTLRSNDHQAAIQQKLALRKFRQCATATAHPYLSHPDYLKYRTRARKDVDKKTGEIIWPDEIENAFQNAVLYIPPMGRRKKAQRGKPHGRNELISEWIKQATGAVRERKQVSSHMQVLDKIFRDTPEWKVVNREPSDPTNDIHGGSLFYENSIEDLVRYSRTLLNNSYQQPGIIDDIRDTWDNFSPNHIATERPRLNRMELEISVSPSDDMETALHKYTSMQSNTSTAAPCPLESIRGWRANFPSMAHIVEETHSVDDFDVILMTSSLHLMNDYPPAGSKLAITFSLEFTGQDPLPSNHVVRSQIWNCRTNIFHRGKLLHSAENANCDVGKSLVIYPGFESKWWAYEFTRLTEKRRRAQDSNNEAAMAAADEAACNFLQGLTVVQEIAAGPDDSPFSQGVWVNGAVKYRRIAVLLWTFSRAQSDFVGTTSWQNLILPPKRATTNSPSSALFAATVPPLSMESMISQSFGNLDNQDFEMEEDDYDPSPKTEEEMCQDGFMMVSHPGTHDISLSNVYDNQVNLPNFSDYGVMMPSNDFGNYGSSYLASYDQPLSSNVLYDGDIHQHNNQATGHNQYHTYLEAGSSCYDSDVQQHRKPLHDFDMETHKQLQAGLESMQEDTKTQVEGQAFMGGANGSASYHIDAAATTTTTETLETTVSRVPESEQNTSQPVLNVQDRSAQPSTPEFVAPVAIRPAFLQHHSYTYGLSASEQVMPDTPRNEFARLLENIGNHQEQMIKVKGFLPAPALDLVSRAHSQPSLTALISNEDLTRTSKDETSDEYIDIKVDDVCDSG